MSFFLDFGLLLGTIKGNLTEPKEGLTLVVDPHAPLQLYACRLSTSVWSSWGQRGTLSVLLETLEGAVLAVGDLQCQ